MVECLRCIRTLLNEVDRIDRIKFCKADFDLIVKSLIGQKIWSTDLHKEVVAILEDYFNQNAFRNMPTTVLQEILLWISVDQFSPITAVCWEWNEIGCSNEVWMRFYQQKFILNNPGPLPSLQDDIQTKFRMRLDDPEIGDKVEVAWKGKFRLETQDVYQGLAWWVAEIVDKHQTQSRYKIRYPGWESRWDEWVPRERLRWAVYKNELVGIRMGDVVELWCCGANVPGAWLEAKVKKIRNNRFCIGKVSSAGHLWVERARLRLVRRGDDQNLSESRSENQLYSSMRLSLSNFVSSIGSNGIQSVCCIM